ncbi:MAG: helix-turn-helix domain-containing protein [Prevotellaceae bacterium]|jgi:transcriptional regulator with XRE-family HTH domain|nr:helix-turn-helix domain-containing protein [Prevotellaceae bacterium]
MNLHKIRELAENRDGGMRKLAKDIGMSESNLHKCVNKNSIGAGYLESIAKIFNIPVTYFFEDTDNKIIQTGNNNQVGSGNIIIESQAHEIEYLKQLLAEKERTITILVNKNK